MTSITHEILDKLQDATTYGFNEIRLGPAYEKALSADRLLLNTIELYCFGDYQYYMDNQPSFLVLNPAALNKLKQLTLISEALKSNCFSYEHLKAKVDIHSNSELERLITESIYNKIIDAKLNSQEQLIKISTSKGRDVLQSDDPRFDNIQRKYPEVQTDKNLFDNLRSFKDRIAKADKYLNEIKDSFEQEKEKIKSDIISDLTYPNSPNIHSDGESSGGASKAISNISISSSMVSVGSSAGSSAAGGNSSRKRKIENK